MHHSSSEPSPPYEAMSPDSQTTADSVLNRTPALASRPSMIITHALALTPNNTTKIPSYPSELGIYDVNANDWSAFTSRLRATPPALADPKGNQAAGGVEHVTSVISQWNQSFFIPRGVQIQPRWPADGKSSAEGFGWANGPQKFGVTVGDKVIGLQVGKDLSGMGLNLGSLIVGVSTTKQEKQEKK